MITKEDLVKRYNKWFQDNEETILKDAEEAKKSIEDFLYRFGSEEKLRDMDLKEDYAFKAKSNRRTFCYLVDFGTDNLGINRCSFQSGYQRYGLQLKENGEWLPFCKEHGITREQCEEKAKEVYSFYLEQTIELLKATKSGDQEAIRNIKMPKPHVNKLHYIFSNGKSINIYVNPDLDKLFDALGISKNKKDDVFIKRQRLLKYMNEAFLGTNITPWLFCRFLYSESGLRPLWKPKKFSIQTLPESLKVKKLNLNVPVREHNQPRETSNDGRSGEDLFYEFLLTNPHQFHISDVNKIKRIHLNPETGIHCDFSYETNDGQIVYVEIKSSLKKDKNKPYFFMSNYEYEFMEDHENNYVLYYLANASKNNRCFTKITVEEIKKYCVAREYIFDVE